MNARELTTRLAALQKMINEKEPATGIITLLETLKEEVVPTEDLLRVSFFLVPLQRFFHTAHYKRDKG